MMGHKYLQTTQIYAKIVDETKREAIRKAALALSQSELGRLSGVFQESINRILRGLI